MIEVEFISSPDPEATGKRKIFFDRISLGTSLDSDIIVFDYSLNEESLKMEITSDGVIVQNATSDFYHSNGKKIRGRKLHKQNDEIKIGDTAFRIISYSKTLPDNVEISDLYSNAIEAHPELETIFEGLEQELIQIEAAKHDEQ